METRQITLLKKPCAGLSLQTLKIIAIVAMTIDHAATAFVPEMSLAGLLLHSIGRITGPTMFFAAVEGFHHTHDLDRYMLRLGVFAILSWFPFVYFMCGGDLAEANYLHFDVIYTIFMGVLGIRIRRSPRLPAPVKVLLLAVLLLLCIPADWNWTGFLMILVFDFYYGRFRDQAFGYSLVVFLGMGVLTLLVTPFHQLLYEGGINIYPQSYYLTLVRLGAYLPLALLALYNGQRGGQGKLSKWFFYWYYPLHLLALGFLQKIL